MSGKKNRSENLRELHHDETDHHYRRESNSYSAVRSSTGRRKTLHLRAGLYGLGCATFTQRIHGVREVIERHLTPFLIGREVSRIEELWQMMMVHGYWRNGPILNNAISGVDQALWDIKGKIANMPVFDLLGGKSREAAQVYVHADGASPDEVAANATQLVDQGYRHVRVQQGLYGGNSNNFNKPEGAPAGAYFDPKRYQNATLRMLEEVRNQLGDEIELLHDVHERLTPSEAIRFARDIEEFRLFFLEDLLAPEDLHWFERVRAHTTTPLAMGELFNHPLEWRTLIEGRLIDFIRMHVSQMGGITPPEKRQTLHISTAFVLHGMGLQTHRQLAMPQTFTLTFGLRRLVSKNGTDHLKLTTKCFRVFHE